MPTNLSSIKTTRDTYKAIVANAIAKLPKGHGITIKEMAKLCKIELCTFYKYNFPEEFKTVTINKVKYFTK